jgi:hypothetical protein
MSHGHRDPAVSSKWTENTVICLYIFPITGTEICILYYQNVQDPSQVCFWIGWKRAESETTWYQGFCRAIPGSCLSSIIILNTIHLPRLEVAAYVASGYKTFHLARFGPICQFWLRGFLDFHS